MALTRFPPTRRHPEPVPHESRRLSGSEHDLHRERRCLRSDLLDPGEEPVAAGAAGKGPELLRVARMLRIALHDGAGLAAARRVVDGAPMKEAGGVLHRAFVPGLAHIAFHQLDLLDMVLDALAS